MSQRVRPAMASIGGMSVRGEIDARIEATWADAYAEAIRFLAANGEARAAAMLEAAAFTDTGSAGSCSIATSSTNGEARHGSA